MADTPKDSSADSEYAVPIHRYAPRESGFELASGDDESIARLTEHIDAHFGPIETVFHEIISDLIHIDVHFIPPTAQRPYHTLVTTGMSDRGMQTPPGAEDFGYTELMVMLPPDWPISQDAFKQEANYWPILWLKRLARFPHEYNTWLFQDHTVPNGDPAQPFAPGTELCCWWLLKPMNATAEAASVKISPEKTVHFVQLIPLYREEMEVKLRRQSKGLLDVLERTNLTLEQLYIINRKRPNAVTMKRGFWPFRR